MLSRHAFSRSIISGSSSSSCRCWDCSKKPSPYRIRSPNRCCGTAFQPKDRHRRLLAHRSKKTEHDSSVAGHYCSEFNVARNWLNAGRPLDGPRPGAIGVKAHHVFQVIRVVDHDHVLAISGNDHNDVRTRVRPTSDVIGWRDVTNESTAAGKPAADAATADKPAADKVGSDKSSDDVSAQGP